MGGGIGRCGGMRAGIGMDEPLSQSGSRSWRWPVRRLILSCQLYERGWSFDEIARHPDIKSTARNVRRALRRAGADLDDFRRGKVVRILVRHAALPALEAAARTRRIDLDELLDRLVSVLASDPALVRNVLDDEAA